MRVQSLVTRYMSPGQLELGCRFYSRAHHEILNQSEKDQVHRDIAHWLIHVLDR